MTRCHGLLALPILLAAPAWADEPPTWYRDVQPIFQEHCEGCHRPGDIGPFAIASAEDAAGWAPMIDEVVEDSFGTASARALSACGRYKPPAARVLI